MNIPQGNKKSQAPCEGAGGKTSSKLYTPCPWKLRSRS